MSKSGNPALDPNGALRASKRSLRSSKSEAAVACGERRGRALRRDVAHRLRRGLTEAEVSAGIQGLRRACPAGSIQRVLQISCLAISLGMVGTSALPAWAASGELQPSSWGNRGVLVGGTYKPLKYPLPELYIKHRGFWKRGGGLWPFLLTILVGNRVGLEWNDGRNVRGIEYVRGVPYVGWAAVPFFCVETFSEKSMQQVANKSGIDRSREAKYEAYISQLEASGRHEEAAYFRRINPFDADNRPPDPMARIPKKELDGFKGNFKAFWVEMIVGHRAALERTEGRGLRTLEKFYFLIVPKLYEAFEAMFGRGMEAIARKEGLDEVWLRKRLKAQQVESNSQVLDDGAMGAQPNAVRGHPVYAAGISGR